MGDELTANPLAQLSFRTLLGLADVQTNGLQLCLVERVGQRIQQVLRTATLCFTRGVGLLALQVGQEMHITT